MRALSDCSLRSCGRWLRAGARGDGTKEKPPKQDCDKKKDLPVGKFRWLTFVSSEEPDDVELLLDPNDNAAARTYQEAIFEQGIPLTGFAVEDVHREYERMKKLGVVFRMEPTKMGPATVVIFDDTCGNLVQLYQV